jgi:hypothetical protein
MSIEHIVRCDVLLPSGHRCESRGIMKTQFDLPSGWRTVTQFERPTADQSPFGGTFAPVMSVAKASLMDELVSEEDKAKRERSVGQLIDNMQAAALEHAPNVVHTAHVCDKHDMPELQLTPHSLGCVGY